MDKSFFLNKINVITGGFGSGKSEYAINLALSLAALNSPVTLVDLDLVNAYFRSREAIEILNRHNIKVVIPPKEIVFSDLPIAGPGIRDLIISPPASLILDVGGDDTGAIALSAYRRELNNAAVNGLMVINPFRPFTADIEQIRAMKENIEMNSGVSITAIVSNPNLGSGTPPDLIMLKHLVVEKAARELGLPLVEMLIHHEVFHRAPQAFTQLKVPVRLINIFLSPAWLLQQQKEAHERIVPSKLSGTTM